MAPLADLANHEGPWIQFGAAPAKKKKSKGKKKSRENREKLDTPAPRVSGWWLLAAGAGGMLLLGLFQAWKHRQDQKALDASFSAARDGGEK